MINYNSVIRLMYVLYDRWISITTTIHANDVFLCQYKVIGTLLKGAFVLFSIAELFITYWNDWCNNQDIYNTMFVCKHNPEMFSHDSIQKIDGLSKLNKQWDIDHYTVSHNTSCVLSN